MRPVVRILLPVLVATCAVWLVAGRESGGAGGAPPPADAVSANARAATAEAAAAPASSPDAARTAVVVLPRAADDVGDDVPDALAGRVVDERGQPVAGAVVWSGFQGCTAESTTAADGSFVLRRGDAPTGSHVLVHASCPGRDVARAWLRWGGDDHELVLARGVPVVVQVVDETGAPVAVEQVTLRGRAGTPCELAADPGDATWRTVAPRGEGELQVTPAEPDRASERFAWPQAQRVLVADPGPVQQQVVLVRAVHRTVVVEDDGGAPLADARVQLVDERDPDAPEELATGTTAADGTTRLAAPADRPVVVVARHERHAPRRLDGVRWDAAGPLVLRLPRGAELAGRVVLDDALRASLAENDWCVRLFVLDAGRRWPDRDRHWWQPFALDASGCFALAGAPTGRCWLSLEATPAARSDRDMARFERRENELLRVDLVPGWNAPVVIDLPARLTCTVRARVTVDGVPAAGYVRLVRAPERLAAFRHAGSGAAAIADADGRFACRVPPGRYRLELERDDAAQVWATAPVDLPAGDEERAFAIMTGVLDLVLRDPDGAPARGARVGVAERRTDRVWWFDQADGDGALRLRLPAGSWGVFDRAPGARLDRSDLVQAAADACRELGRVAVRAGETARATIVVPPR